MKDNMKQFSYTKEDYEKASVMNAINVAQSIDGITEIQKDAINILVKIAHESMRKD